MNEPHEARYIYGFTPWPDGDCTLSASMQRLVRMIKYRHEERMTAREFGEFRIGLQVDGIDLHEIDRIPYHRPETVL